VTIATIFVFSFTTRAYLNDRGFPEANSNNKKDAKKKAATRALMVLVREGKIDASNTLSPQVSVTKFISNRNIDIADLRGIDGNFKNLEEKKIRNKTQKEYWNLTCYQ